MAPFRWPELMHDVALATEVLAKRPAKTSDWEDVAQALSTNFSAQDNPVQLKGRGCKERMELLLKKYKRDDARALKRSGTEEDYGSLQQLLEDIATFYDDCASAKDALLAKKEYEVKKKEEDKKRRGMDMRKAAMEARSKTPPSCNSSIVIDDDEDGDIDLEAVAPLPKKAKRTKMSAVDVLSEKSKEKMSIRREELEVRKMELDLKRRQLDLEEKVTKQRLEQDAEQRKLFMDLIKKHMLDK